MLTYVDECCSELKIEVDLVTTAAVFMAVEQLKVEAGGGDGGGAGGGGVTIREWQVIEAN